MKDVKDKSFIDSIDFMCMLYIPEADEGWLERAAIREGNPRGKWKREEFR